jgi:hypothetical protein
MLDALVFLAVLVLTILLTVKRTRVIAAIALGVLLLVLLVPVRKHAGPEARRSQCMNNLKEIALGLHNYHDAYGSFPPAYIADDNGKPMHSWRVLLLPFVEMERLYQQYRFDEPWDGPNNSSLAASHPQMLCYDCPSEYAAPMTSYVAVVGPGTAWYGAKPRYFEEFADGLDCTIMVVEVANSGIHWMEPRDLDFSTLPMVVNPPQGMGISSKHSKSAGVVFADISVRFLDDDLPAQTLRALLTIDGGETVNLDEL